MTSLNIFHVIMNDNLSFKQLIQKDETVLDQISEVDMNTTLHVAAKHAYVHIVREIVKLRPDLVEALNAHRETPVHMACFRGDIQVLDALLAIKPWVAYCLNTKRENALFLACKYGHLEIVERLIETSYYFTPDLSYIDVAMANGNQDVAQELIENWPNLIEKVDENGLNLLHYACKYGEPKIARMLLKLNPDLVSTYDSSGFAPLHLTAIHGNNSEAIFEEFEGLAPHAFQALTRNQDTILHLTASHNQFQTYLNLMHFLGDSDAHNLMRRVDRKGNTLLHVVLSGGCIEFAEHLISISTKEELLAINDEGFTVDVGNSGENDSVTLRLRDCLEKRWAELKISFINSVSKTESVHRSQASSANRLNHSQSRESLQMTGQELGESEHLEDKTSPISHAEEESWKEIVKALHELIEGERKQDCKSRRDEKMKAMHSEALQNARNTITIIAILISTITFTGCLSPPGGFFQDGPLIGKPTMVRTTAFKLFSICNDVALFLSLGIVIILASIVPFRKKPLRNLIGVAHKVLCVAVGFMATGYLAARWATTVHIGHEKRMTKVSLISCGVFLIMIFIGSAIMVINTKIKKRKWKRDRKIARTQTIKRTIRKSQIDRKRLSIKSMLSDSKIENKPIDSMKFSSIDWMNMSVDSDMASSRITGYHAY